jgi:hypothetical protein
MAGIQSIHESIPDDLLKPMLEEFRTGWSLRKAQAEATKKALGQLNQLQHRHVDGLGQMTARIPEESYHYWGQRLGYACWRDNGFMKNFLRDNPECRVNSKAEKTTLLVDGFGRSLS